MGCKKGGHNKAVDEWICSLKEGMIGNHMKMGKDKEGMHLREANM